jgi:hypothetical protein
MPIHIDHPLDIEFLCPVPPIVNSNRNSRYFHILCLTLLLTLNERELLAQPKALGLMLLTAWLRVVQTHVLCFEDFAQNIQGRVQSNAFSPVSEFPRSQPCVFIARSKDGMSRISTFLSFFPHKNSHLILLPSRQYGVDYESPEEESSRRREKKRTITRIGDETHVLFRHLNETDGPEKLLRRTGPRKKPGNTRKLARLEPIHGNNCL